MKHKSNLKLAFFLNFFFTIFELIGGLLTNSVALIADAIHDLGDSLSILMAWILETLSGKKPTDQFSYGFGRLSLLGGLLTSVILVVGIVFVLIETIPRLLNPQEVNAPLMIPFALVGLTVNGYAAYKTAHGKSINERVISLHLLEDVLGWAALLIAAVVMSLVSIPILDPLLSLFFSAFILWHVIKNLKDIGIVFLEGLKSPVRQEAIKEALQSHEHIQGVHHIHTWSLDGHHTYITLHVLLNKALSIEAFEETRHFVRKTLQALGFTHSTVECEYAPCQTPDCVPPTLEMPTHGHHHH